MISWWWMIGSHAVLGWSCFVDVEINDLVSAWARNLNTHAHISSTKTRFNVFKIIRQRFIDITESSVTAAITRVVG